MFNSLGNKSSKKVTLPYIKRLIGFEPIHFETENQNSIHLSYKRFQNYKIKI